MKDFHKILEEEKGQALIEFVFFLPFMLAMYQATLAISNSLNAAINQQKVTRSYFYYRIQNNSTIPEPVRSGSGGSYQNWSSFGMTIIGWAEEVIDNKPVATCFNFNLPIKGQAEDSCKEAYSEKTTQFIRVGTVYGICGATYLNDQGEIIRMPASQRDPLAVIGPDSCLIR